MSKNLRIIYNNVADISTTTLSVSSTHSAATSSANLKLDTKSKVWRSGTTSGTVTGALANILITSSVGMDIGGVIFPFTNLSSSATIRIRGYTGTAPVLGGTVDVPTITASGTLTFDTGFVNSCPWNIDTIWNYSNTPYGSNTYAYGGGTYARVWIPTNIQAGCTSLTIEIIDTGNSSKYIEVSRLILGQYWSPIYNLPFGLSYNLKDMSSHSRSESGNIVTNRGPRYGSLSFDLKWLSPADRATFNTLLKSNGIGKPLFVSLFPDNDADWYKEQAHQIYGKLSQISSIQHPVFEIYSSQIELEEV